MFASPAPVATAEEGPASRSNIPLAIKIVYSAFVAVLVPYYWHAYSAWNFLYFCDVALLMTLVGVWTESRFIASLEAIAILLPQTLWVVDFVVRACGVHVLGLTDYMFDPHLPLFTRGLSLFHGWLPFFLVYLLVKLGGYDRRAFAWQCVIGVALVWACFFFAPRPPAPANWPNLAVNVNYVWGLDDKHPQTWMPPAAWVATLSAFFVLGIYVPTHLALRKVFAPGA
jgi:hypothetical protein